MGKGEKMKILFAKEKKIDIIGIVDFLEGE